MTTSNDTKAVIALTTRLGDKERPSLSPTRWHHFSSLLRDVNLMPADVFDAAFDPANLPGIKTETASTIQRLLQDASLATVAAADLERKGIWIQTIVDSDYPDALSSRAGRNAPPVIFGVGNRSLLEGEGVGIVGSRNVDPLGAEVAQRMATASVQIERPVVSGGARGVDQLAMNAAHQAGGSVLGVLADALTSGIRQPDILHALDAGSTCLITQQLPSAGFSAGSAMSRNKLIYALSVATVVIATDEDSGGTWAGAIEAIRTSNGRVLVWRGPGEGPGNDALEERGASAMREVDSLPDLLAGASQAVESSVQQTLELPT